MMRLPRMNGNDLQSGQKHFKKWHLKNWMSLFLLKVYLVFSDNLHNDNYKTHIVDPDRSCIIERNVSVKSVNIFNRRNYSTHDWALNWHSRDLTSSRENFQKFYFFVPGLIKSRALDLNHIKREILVKQ